MTAELLQNKIMTYVCDFAGVYANR